MLGASHYLQVVAGLDSEREREGERTRTRGRGEIQSEKRARYVYVYVYYWGTCKNIYIATLLLPASIVVQVLKCMVCGVRSVWLCVLPFIQSLFPNKAVSAAAIAPDWALKPGPGTPPTLAPLRLRLAPFQPHDQHPTLDRPVHRDYCVPTFV